MPAPPALDVQRWFQALVATLALHDVEAAGGDTHAWEDRLAGILPRDTWPPGPRLSMLDDPIELGADYDPGAWLGAGRGWQGLADAEATRDAVRARVRQRWVLLGEHALLDAIAKRAEVDRPQVAAGEPEAAADALYTAIAEEHSEQAQRYVLAAAGVHAHTVARAMVGHPGLRDQVDAVVAVDAKVDGGDPRHAAWLAEHFTHTRLDREQFGRTPWLALRGPEHPEAAASWPTPPADRDEIWGVQPVDLGVVHVDAAPDVVARALVLLTALQALTQR